MKSLQDTYARNTTCFGCGPANAQGLQLKSFAEDDGCVADYRVQKHHEAFPGVVNGGIIGALLDCHSNWAATLALMRRSGAKVPPCTVTSDFHVVLKRPTPSGAVLKLHARATEVADDRAVVDAILEADGKLRATCKGTFVAVREGHPAFHRW